MKLRHCRSEKVQARVNDILRATLDGSAGWEIVDYVRRREQEPGSPWELREGEEPLSYVQIRRYINKAGEAITDSLLQDRQALISSHVAKRRHIYHEAMQAKDLPTALRALDSEAKLLALFPDEDRPSKPTAPITLNVIEQVIINPRDEPRAIPAIEVVNEDHGHADGSPKNGANAPCPAIISE